MDQGAAEAGLETGQAHRTDAARHLAVDHRQEPEAGFARLHPAKLSSQTFGLSDPPGIIPQAGGVFRGKKYLRCRLA